MCTVNDDNTITPCGGNWPEETHAAAWHPHANCPTCADQNEVTYQALVEWLVRYGARKDSWSYLAERLMKEFRVLRKEKV